MTIDKAIEELTKQLGPKYSTPHTDFHNAIKLGIEALKRIKSLRTNMGSQKFWQLPGETKD